MSYSHYNRTQRQRRAERVSNANPSDIDLDRALGIAAELIFDYGDKFLGFYQLIEQRHAAYEIETTEKEKARDRALKIATRHRVNPVKPSTSASSLVSPSMPVQRRILGDRVRARTNRPVSAQAPLLRLTGPEMHDEGCKE